MNKPDPTFGETTPLGHEALESFWLPFTPNRQFKENPRLFVAAEGMHRSVVRQRRPWPTCDYRRHQGASRAARLRIFVSDEPSGGIRAGATNCRDFAAGLRPRLLHQFRVRSLSNGSWITR